MRILLRLIDAKDGQGLIKLQPDEPEDLWHIYNLLSPDDRVTSMSYRKVQNLTATGSSTNTKVKLKMTLSVDTIDYDATGHTIRIKGRNLEENKFVKLGQFHTIELGLNRAFTLWKPRWDSIYLERVDTAADPSSTAEAAVILLQTGLAHVNLLTSHMTTTVAKIETPIQKKRLGSTTRHDKSMIRFFENVLNAIVSRLRFDIIKCVIIASPSFLRDDFMTFMFEEATKRDMKPILNNKAKFMSVHCSSGHMQALKEVLADPAVLVRIENTKAVSEVKALDDFYNMLNINPDRAFYGFNHVQIANRESAVETLLITDDLFRSADLQTRLSYVNLVEAVRENGGIVHIFSALHQSGQQLQQLTGIAAILRFPVHMENDVNSDDSDDDGIAALTKDTSETN